MKNRTPDHILVEKLHGGDLEAFDQIFQRYGNRLFGFAIKYLKSKEESEGLVQDVFLKIWENRKKIKKESSLKSYLFTIAYHNMCKIFRKRQSYLSFVEESVAKGNKIIHPDEQMEYQAALEQVNRLIEKLPEKQKLIFIKSRREGKSNKEIAEELMLSPGTIDNNISAAISFLRKHFSEEKFALLLFFAIFIR